MKKLFTLLVGALLGVSAIYAEQTVFIGETGYDSLEAAVNAAAAGSTITLTGDQTISGNRITIQKKLTIKGEENKEVKIYRAIGFTNNMLFLVNNSGNLSFENIIFDGNNVNTDKITLEAATDKETLNLTNVKFVNCKTTNGTGLVKLKGNHILKNVETENCTVPEGRGDFLVGADNRLTVSGSGKFSLYIESTYKIKADNFTGICTIFLDPTKISTGRNIAEGGTAENFIFANAPEGYNFTDNGGDVVIGSFIPVIKNESTGQSYSTFEEAVAACTDSDNTLILTHDCDVTKRLMPAKNLVIKGETGNEVLKSTFGNSLFLAVGSGASLTLEDLVLDCNFEGNNKSEIEASSSASLILKNVKIINSKTDTYLIDVKGNSRGLSLINVHIEDCTNNYVHLQSGAKLNISGNNNFAIYCADAKQTITAIEDGIDHTDNFIYITYEDVAGLEEDQLIVSNCVHGSRFRITNRRPEPAEPAGDNPSADEPSADDDQGVFLMSAKKKASPYDDELYPLENQHYFLYSKDGQHLYLTTDKATGVKKVATEVCGKVNVIDFAGRVIRRNVESENALVGLPAGMYIVGTRKVIVR